MSLLQSILVILEDPPISSASAGSETITSMFWVGDDDPVSKDNATPSWPPDVHSPASLTLILYVSVLSFVVNYSERSYN